MSAPFVFSKRHLTTCVFILNIGLLFVFKFNFHEFWKDEWQAWQVATTTPSVGAMLKVLPFEGHPSGWYLYLRGFHIVSSLFFTHIDNSLVISIIHFLLVLGCYWLLFYKFQIPLLIKGLFGLSYFMLFEYGVVNRGYALAILLFFICIYLLKKNHGNHTALILPLFALTQTEVYGLFMAFSLIIYLFLRQSSINKKTIVYSSVAIVVGTVLFSLTLLSSAASHVTFEQLSVIHISRFFAAFQAWLGGSIAPSLISSKLNGPACVFSLAILVGYIFVFRKQSAILYSFLTFCFLSILFSSLIYIGGPRQWGMMLVFLIGMLELSDIQVVPKYSPKLAIFSGIFLLSCWQCGLILSKEKKYLYSNAILAGQFIQNQIPTECPVIAINKAFATPVLGYSRRNVFYTLPNGEPFTYFLWKEKIYYPSMQELMNYQAFLGKPIFILSYRPLPLEAYTHLHLVQSFDEPSIRDENYYLYQIQ